MTDTARPDLAFRDVRDRLILWQQLDRLHEARRVTMLVQGGWLTIASALRWLDGESLPDYREWDRDDD